MNIGITYDLKTDYTEDHLPTELLAELDKPETINAISDALTSQGHAVEKIGHFKKLSRALLDGKRWNLVFNIAEGLYGIGRESTVPCLLDAYQIPYVFSDPAVLAVCLHKGITKQMIDYLKIPTAEFLIVNQLSDLEKLNIPFPLFAKPVAEGTGKGINSKSILHHFRECEETVKRLLDLYQQPVLIEKFLSGREFTVGMIGTGKKAYCLGIMEIHFNEKIKEKIYSYQNKADYELNVHYSLLKNEPSLIKKIETLSLNAWQGLGCRDGGRMDIRCDENHEPMFVEVNPLAGLHPEDSDLVIMSRLKNISYDSLIQRIVNSAAERIKK